VEIAIKKMETKNIDLTKLTPKIRKLSDMKSVIYDQKWLETTPDAELYYMYGNLIEDGDLKYSITVVPPNNLGKEFVKTMGHVHIGDYKETYTVLDGNAVYLMQKTNGETVEDVYAVMAKKGESIIIPSGYGHVTINASNETLKTGDWRNSGCKQDYSLFEKMRGACYYYTKDGWVKNENYKNIPELQFKEPLKDLPNLDFLR
jgi:glucose-6-phosphate isomerase